MNESGYNYNWVIVYDDGYTEIVVADNLTHAIEKAKEKIDCDDDSIRAVIRADYSYA